MNGTSARSGMVVPQSNHLPTAQGKNIFRENVLHGER